MWKPLMKNSYCRGLLDDNITCFVTKHTDMSIEPSRAKQKPISDHVDLKTAGRCRPRTSTSTCVVFRSGSLAAIAKGLEEDAMQSKTLISERLHVVKIKEGFYKVSSTRDF